MERDELWRQADDLFQELLALEPVQREARLEAFDGPDAVAARVRRLLALEEESGDFLESDSVPIPEGALERVETRARTDLPEGTRVGRYEVTGVLGRGGTSTVYRARRADGTFEQEIAVKVVRSDLRPDELARRMRSERQILATLSHPNLARVFDGGLTGDGRPWLGVELVEGERIDRWADRRRLSIRDRLRLFLQVLGAVQHAHRNLVVHRDLKPSNILVNDDGVVKLLDFGVAKLLAPDGEPGLADATQLTEARWITPNYAAPEQLLGRPVTTATDIHALGVVLYEVLTGQRPFPTDGSTRFAVERAICETEPRPPSASVTAPTDQTTDPAELARSRATTTRELRHTLGGDLDAILLKALRKEPERRYTSAEEFARDIRRFLDGRTVEARGDGLGYRTRKFVARHWLPLGAAALLVLTLAGSAISLGLSRSAVLAERNRAEAAAAQAEEEAANARAVVAFLADVFRGRDPNAAPADTITALELVEWAEERVDTEFDGQPDLQMELLAVLGDAYENLGYPEEGLRLHDRSLQVALASSEPDSPEIVDALDRLTSNRRYARDFVGALAVARAALALVREHHPADTARLADALTQLGLTARELGSADTAVTHLRRAVELERAAGWTDTEGHTERLLSLAYVLRSAGEYDEAEARYREGIQALRASDGYSPVNLAGQLNNLGYLLRRQEDYAGADTLYREALAITTEAYGRGHPNTVMVASNLASVLSFQDRPEAVTALLDDNLEALRDQWPDDHWRVGAGLEAAGLARLRTGRLEAALPLLEEGLRIYRLSLGTDNLWTSFAAVDVELARHHLDPSVPLDRLQAAYDMARGWHDTPAGMRPVGANLVAPLVSNLEALEMEEWAERFEALLPEGTR